MKKIFLLVIISALLLLTNCDYTTCLLITNHTSDTILVYFASYDNIDGVAYGVSSDWEFELKFDETGKVVFENSDVIIPDSYGRYCELVPENNLLRRNEDQKGYFFIIKLETIKNYTWEEIRKNKLYEELIVTREMLEENGRNIDYYSKEDKK
jgi:hypothetical protein